MTDMMALVVGWTLVGAFIFTVIVTCLSLVGWVRFADKSQQRKLFSALIVELVLGVGSWTLGASKYDAAAVGRQLRTEGSNEAILDVLNDALTVEEDQQPEITRDQASRLVDRFDPLNDAQLFEAQNRLRNELGNLPAGPIPIEASIRLNPIIDPLRRSDRRRAPGLSPG